MLRNGLERKRPACHECGARKSVTIKFNLNVTRAFFRVEATLTASGDARSPVIFLNYITSSYLAKTCEKSANALNSSAFPLGSRKNIVACSPVSP